MSLIRRIEAIEPFYSPSFFSSSFSEYSSSFSSSIFAPQTLIYPPFPHETEEAFFALDLIAHYPYAHPTPLELFDAATDLIQTPPPPPRCFRSYKRLYRRFAPHDTCVDLLCDRFYHLVMCGGGGGCGDRKYKWTAEIEGKHVDGKYKWTAEIKEKEREKENRYHYHRHYRHCRGYHHHHCYDDDLDCYHYYYDQGKEGRSYKWTAEIEEKGVEGPVKRTYKWQTTIGEEGKEKKKKEKEKNKKKKNKKEECRLVEIVEPNDVEPNDHRAVVLRQAFTKKNAKGKKKELSPPDAALMIQRIFRAYLIRRSQALRALRELAVAKSKLKEIWLQFNNFSYRRRIACDAEERQRFSERIIVLLLTVDALEGADLMVRAAKRSVNDELEAMLDVVDPQHPGKLLAMRRRRAFDVPDGGVKKEIADGVAQIVRMLDQEENSTAV